MKMASLRSGAIVLALLFAVAIRETAAESFTEDEAVERALASSPSLRYAEAVQAAKEASFALGIRAFFPELSVGYDDSTSIAMDAPDTRSKSLSLTLTQPLFDGGIASRERAMARLELALSRNDIARQSRELERSVRSLFNAILVGQKKRDILAETIAMAIESLDIMRAEQRLGVSTELDAVEAEVEKLELELDLEKAEQEISDSLYQLKKALSLDFDARVELVGELPVAREILHISGEGEALLPLAAAASSELGAQDAAVRKARIALRSARSAFIPTIELEFAATVSGSDFPLSDPSLSGKLLFTFSAPEMPTSYSGSASSAPFRNYGGATSLAAAPLKSISGWIDRRSAKLSLDAEARKKEEMLEDLRFTIRQRLEQYATLERQFALTSKRLSVQRQKSDILEKRLSLGEVKRIDRLKGAIDAAETEIELGESSLALLEAERDWEELLGLDREALNALFGKGGLR